MKQLENIVESVRQNRFKIERRQQEEKHKRDGLNIQLSELVDKARQYAKVTKDFQEVRKKHFFYVFLFCNINFFSILGYQRKRISFNEIISYFFYQ